MYKKLKSVKFWINTFFLISLIITPIFFVLCLGGSGVLKDYENALIEMKVLEKNDFQTLPSKAISTITQREMKFFKTSAEFQDYIVKQDQLLSKTINIFYFSVLILVVTMFLKLFFYFKSKNYTNKKLN